VVMQALLPLTVLLALFLAVRRGDLAFLPALFLYGGGVGFVVASYVTGSIIANLRYYSLELPMLVVAVAMLPAVDLARPHLGGSTSLAPLRPARWVRLEQLGFAVLAAALLLGSVPLMVNGVQNSNVDPSDYDIRSVLFPARYPLAVSGESSGLAYGTAISAYITSLHLHDGAVLLDTWGGFPIAMSAANLKTYTITSDLDFTAALNDPTRFGVQYFLVPSPTGVGELDAINRRYWTFWETGSGFATLALTFTPPQTSLAAWRLYRITPSPGGG